MNRTTNVMKVIGWKGGTVHDLCRYLGIDVHDFLYKTSYASYTNSSYNQGLYITTCGVEFINKVLVPSKRGDVDYWIGAARGVELINSLNTRD